MNSMPLSLDRRLRDMPDAQPPQLEWPAQHELTGGLTPPTITLIRHGRPNLSRRVRLTADEYRQWWSQYDQVGLWPGQTVPPHIPALIQNAHILSSPLPRALESARMALGGQAPDRIVNGLVEAPLPPPPLGNLRLHPISWGTLSRLIWMAGRSAGGESVTAARRRATHMADELATLSQDRPVTVFAHGWFNRMVGRQLRRRGWRCVEGRGDGYWSFRRYVKD